MRILLSIAYEGTAYAGWQIQGSAQARPTIQGRIEKALHALCGQPTRIHGAGRTDAGVHALDQKAHFDAPDHRQGMDWRKCLNALLPPDIRITSANTVAGNFHARNDATGKTYVYRFWTDQRWLPPQLRNWCWACGPLDQDAIRQALPAFLGRHDFASFQNAGTPVKTTVREIRSMRLEQLPRLSHIAIHAPMLECAITGSGFLKQMARNMAGLVRDIGSGKLPPDCVAEFLEARDRRRLPSCTAPAKGLFLAKVAYGDAGYGQDAPAPMISL